MSFLVAGLCLLSSEHTGDEDDEDDVDDENDEDDEDDEDGLPLNTGPDKDF